jgi:hypothetical protein
LVSLFSPHGGKGQKRRQPQTTPKKRRRRGFNFPSLLLFFLQT